MAKPPKDGGLPGLPLSAGAGIAPAEFSLEVAKGFVGKTVLLTGVTGYLGELILEQLLRVCPGVEKVYVVVRAKKGQAAEERVTQLLHSPLYHLLHARLPEVAAKVQVIDCDMAELTTKMAPELKATLLRDVNYIIHCAACIRFDLPTSAVIKENYIPTRDLLAFARGMERLECFSFMSTAFVNAHLGPGKRLEERLYPLIPRRQPAGGRPGGGWAACMAAPQVHAEPQEEEELDGLELAEQLASQPSEVADKRGEELMAALGIKNTYFLVKNLTERLVLAHDRAPFPVCVLRPSIVGCVAVAPLPGFIGNTSGLTGAIMGLATGIGTFTQHKELSIVPTVPGDLVSSAALAATVAISQQGGGGAVPTIVHVCSSDRLPLTYSKLMSTFCGFLNEAGPHMRLPRRHYACGHVLSDSGYAARSALRGVKIEAMARMLELKGKKKLAGKLRLCWRTWRELCSREHEYNLRYASGGLEALQGAMAPAEQRTLKCVWDEALGDSWHGYLRTYAAGVCNLLLREAPLPPSVPHTYRVVAAARLQPLAFASLADGGCPAPPPPGPPMKPGPLGAHAATQIVACVALAPAPEPPGGSQAGDSEAGPSSSGGSEYSAESEEEEAAVHVAPPVQLPVLVC